jgi:hypothetical protein
MVVFNLFLIAVITVCIIDISGFVNSIKSALNKVITKRKFSNSNYSIKPFDCSLCMTFWIGLIYLIIYNSVSLINITVLLLIAISTPIINDIIRLIQDLITKLIQVIENYIF